jgi:predicted GTPase
VNDRLLSSVHQLLDAAEPALRAQHAARIPDLRARLDGPLRVAIAGKVKAGKSTLLNALVGEKVAPTDAGECTRVVTWYRNSHVYRVTAVPYEGPSAELRFRRTEDSLEVDLGDHAAEDLRYIDVEWPSERLRDIVLIDTPGLASISEDVSRRTERFLASDEEGPGDADAVIYLMRHLHPKDLSFLEAFRETVATEGAAVNSIAVLSRADEIGAARTNALQAAERVAARYRQDRRIDSLCQVVIPVAGLIAQAAASLREGETNALRTLAGLPREQVTELLLSAERFVGFDSPASPDPAMRLRLLDRLGLFGVRLAVELLVAQRVESAGEVSRELERRSGILELREVLAGQFASRATVLKARSTLATVSALATLDGGPKGRMLRDMIRDIENAAHELVEIRLLSQLRTDPSGLGDDAMEARRLLGNDGPDPHARLVLRTTASPEEVREAAITMIGKWRMLAEDPLINNEARDVARGVIRTCEELAVAGR